MAFLPGLTKFFSTSKSVDDFLDKDTGHLAKIGGWIGNQNFTEEERAKMTASMAVAVRQFSIDTAKESTQRSVTRRKLAISWICTHLALIVATFIAGGLDHEQFERLWLIVSSNVLTFGTGGVMIYFFGSYGYGAHVAGKK